MPSTRLNLLAYLGVLAFGVSSLACLASADDSVPPAKPPTAPDAKTQPPAEDEIPTYNLLDAMRDGVVDVEAEGRGDTRMIVSVTNSSKRQLRVVLPPGLVVQGATGQMGGMGGMGGMGMGGMGGGMGGMGGGMGGMGGRGGMGGGMGGMGGRGGMMMSGTLPPMMGMMMLSRMVMMLCGDYDSWDQRSLRMGMMGMGGMGGMGMGGMGGGMGGMGMGMRSVPPTGLPFADVKPGQTRKLPTRLVSLERPDADNGVKLPAQGEKLQIGEISQINQDPRVQKALKRLSVDKANIWISQMVMWRVASGLDWDAIAQLSQGWSNPYELTLAQAFVNRIDDLPDDEIGVIRFKVDAADAKSKPLADELTMALKDKPVLGLWARENIPSDPLGPAVACRIRIDGDNATVQVNSSDATANAWVPYGKFTVPVVRKDDTFDARKFTDALAEGVLKRLVQARVSKGPKVKGKDTYKVRIDNASPLILNGLAVLGANDADETRPRQLAGFSISPRRSMTVPATEEVAKELGLKKSVHLVAADLSSL
jgi:hypothetical protein